MLKKLSGPGAYHKQSTRDRKLAGIKLSVTSSLKFAVITTNTQAY